MNILHARQQPPNMVSSSPPIYDREPSRSRSRSREPLGRSMPGRGPWAVCAERAEGRAAAERRAERRAVWAAWSMFLDECLADPPCSSLQADSSQEDVAREAAREQLLRSITDSITDAVQQITRRVCSLVDAH